MLRIEMFDNPSFALALPSTQKAITEINLSIIFKISQDLQEPRHLHIQDCLELLYQMFVHLWRNVIP